PTGSPGALGSGCATRRTTADHFSASCVAGSAADAPAARRHASSNAPTAASRAVPGCSGARIGRATVTPGPDVESPHRVAPRVALLVVARERGDPRRGVRPLLEGHDR